MGRSDRATSRIIVIMTHLHLQHLIGRALRGHLAQAQLAPSTVDLPICLLVHQLRIARVALHDGDYLFVLRLLGAVEA